MRRCETAAAAMVTSLKEVARVVGGAGMAVR